ncbi:hypothetical protein TorRG33x02_014620 [Trema orientale]|uniref:Uncharacterized protein n=1 Tax=Trema orientale TaxID=63057 RepID=A0A2P5FXF8_TREOI|nr:hypothetical protein TorRG33x02_014620 [Trema orientale]
MDAVTPWGPLKLPRVPRRSGEIMRDASSDVAQKASNTSSLSTLVPSNDSVEIEYLLLLPPPPPPPPSPPSLKSISFVFFVKPSQFNFFFKHKF